LLYIKESRGDIFKIIGANVRYYRGLYNINNPSEKISQAKLAKICNVSTGLIGSLETGKVLGISIPVLWNISQILDVSIEKFFEDRFSS
jgi:DNA-binding XRE family transcriptional regulator